jgi:hypothetical protein
MMSCHHLWRRVYEEFLLGGSFPIGWECKKCGEFLPQHKVTPEGVPGGVEEGEAKLIAPHGGVGQCADGSPYKEQIVDAHGNLFIRRK